MKSRAEYLPPKPGVSAADPNARATWRRADRARPRFRACSRAEQEAHNFPGVRPNEISL